MDEKKLGKAIGQARRDKGLTQQQLCDKLQLSYSTLAKIERGAIKAPSVFTVALIAKATDTTVEKLIGDQSISQSKKTSLSGIKFVYFDINGVLVRFFHGAFTAISQDYNISPDIIETYFWKYNDLACMGELKLVEFNDLMAKSLNIESFDWEHYYLNGVDKIEEAYNLAVWASENYQTGLLSNIMTGLLQKLIEADKVPNLNYNCIIDSSEVHLIKPDPKIYQFAQIKAGVEAHEILFIDDSRANVVSAERLGWHVMWFDDYSPKQSVERVKKALEF